MNLLVFLLVGLVAGWLAGQIMKGRGFGLVGNLVVGVLGAFLGGFLFEQVGVEASSMIGWIITSTVGALVLLFVVSLIKKS